MLKRVKEYKFNIPKEQFIDGLWKNLQESNYVVSKKGDVIIITNNKSLCHVDLVISDNTLLLKWAVPFYYTLLKIICWILLLILLSKQMNIFWAILIPGMIFIFLWDLAGVFIYESKLKTFVSELENIFNKVINNMDTN